MQIFELLDRFELLYKNNQDLSNLRRAYIDKDWSSIFRLLTKVNDVELVEEYRKAVMEKNLHSLFRLLPEDDLHDDLRKAITEKNLHSLFRLLPEDDLHDDLRKAITEKNLHSLFRILEYFFKNAKFTHSFLDLHDDLRKAVTEQNLHSLFRLLPEDDLHDDLRKAVTEQNLHSLFRLLLEDDLHDDLRKAVTEQNLHSLFRLLPYEDLRKSILEDNIWSIRKLIHDYQPNQLVEALKSFDIKSISINEDCLTRGQIESKTWLVKELSKLNLDLGTVFLCAGWYATLAVLMFESDIKLTKIRSFDIDSSCSNIAEIFNKPWVMSDWKFKSCTQDIFDIDYANHSYSVHRSDGTECTLTDIPDTIINTSCEHISNFKSWYNLIPQGKYVILQTNDYFEIEEHINCSSSLEEFIKTCPMTEILYSGEKDLGKYRRFMVIGIK